MLKWATIVDVKLPFIIEANSQSTCISLTIDDGEEFVGKLYFEIFGLDVITHFGYVNHLIRDCQNSFNQLYNILGLFGFDDVTMLKDTEITIMTTEKGIAISNDLKKDWVVCLDSVPCAKGKYYSKKQAKKLLG